MSGKNWREYMTYLIVLMLCLPSLITQGMDELELHPQEIKVKITVQHTHTRTHQNVP